MKKLIAILLFAGLAFAAIGDRLSITNDNGTIQYFNIDKDGAITSVGSRTDTGNETITGNVAVTGNLSVDGVVNYGMSAVVQLDTSTTLSVTDRYMVIVGSNAATGKFAMTSAAVPFISTTTATAGDTVTIFGSDATGTVTLSDDGVVTGSCLELDGNTIVLGADSNITLVYRGGKWIQAGGINTID